MQLYGISNLENDGLLDLSFSLEDEYLFVKITDNGIGRKKAETLKNREKETLINLKLKASLI